MTSIESTLDIMNVKSEGYPNSVRILSSPCKALTGPEGSRTLRLPECPDNWHTNSVKILTTGTSANLTKIVNNLTTKLT
jgi:3-methyladenine DNA glycosylase AlkC